MHVAIVLGLAAAGFLTSAVVVVLVHRLGYGDDIGWPARAETLTDALLGGPVRTTVAGVRVRTAQHRRARPALGLHLTMAALVAVVALRVGMRPELPAVLVFCTLLVAVSIVDVAVLRIPNRLVYPSVPLLLVLLLGAAVVDGTPLRAVEAAATGLGVFGALVALVVLTPAGIGMGDVKLLGVTGLVLGYAGWATGAFAVLASLLVPTLGSVLLVATGRRHLHDMLPLGPGIAIGAVGSVLLLWPTA